MWKLVFGSVEIWRVDGVNVRRHGSSYDAVHLVSPVLLSNHRQVIGSQRNVTEELIYTRKYTTITCVTRLAHEYIKNAL